MQFNIFYSMTRWGYIFIDFFLGGREVFQSPIECWLPKISPNQPVNKAKLSLLLTLVREHTYLHTVHSISGGERAELGYFMRL